MKNFPELYHQRQSELLSLLAVIYIHPQKAMNALEKRIGRYGFEPAIRMSRENPKILGKLRGTHRLKIYKDAKRRDAEWAAQSIRYPAERWYLSLLQLQQEEKDRAAKAKLVIDKEQVAKIRLLALRPIWKGEIER